RCRDAGLCLAFCVPLCVSTGCRIGFFRISCQLSVMDDALYFGDQHLQVREMVRQFARDEVAPIAAKYDAEAQFPWESIRKVGERGLLAIRWPEELRGAWLGLLRY